MEQLRMPTARQAPEVSGPYRCCRSDPRDQSSEGTTLATHASGVQAAEAAHERELEAAEEARLAAEQQRLRLRWRAEQAAEAARAAEAGLKPGKARQDPHARMSHVVFLSHRVRILLNCIE